MSKQDSFFFNMLMVALVKGIEGTMFRRKIRKRESKEKK